MVDELFQGWGGMGGTANAILSSSDYMSQAQRDLNNIEDGFYISPSFLDKLSIHIAKNFMNLPKIKVPLILGIWGGKGQVRWTGQRRDGAGLLLAPRRLLCCGHFACSDPPDFSRMLCCARVCRVRRSSACWRSRSWASTQLS